MNYAMQSGTRSQMAGRTAMQASSQQQMSSQQMMQAQSTSKSHIGRRTQQGSDQTYQR